MIVYHGSTEIVRKPDINHSYRPLDFGKGFYVTTVKEQAEKWARRKADLYGRDHGIVNSYTMSEKEQTLTLKTFSEDLVEWIDFVCSCRDEGEEYLKYDVIFGKVANDKVFRVVDMYHQGIWDKDRALKEMKIYETYDQIAFISQKAIDQLLQFESYYEV
uniref:DUF3990 domain-containing protein n=1 Tax=Eubacterium cellulosolvens TaxID=29322 RepID=UPI000483069B|nr:DUF3990 domain-containing protein [[Eubacterium] cellulosolvens]